MWKFLMKEIARAWGELRATESEASDSAEQRHAARAALFGQSARRARQTRLRLGMF
jgi:hypothetical protein